MIHLHNALASIKFVCYIYQKDGEGDFMDTQELKNQVNELMRNQKYDEIEPLLFSHRKKTRNDNDLAVTYYLCAVYNCNRRKRQARP